MATLELSINCLCLFVPDEPANTVQVLMPYTNGHHRHVARVLYKGSPEKGVPIEKWALELGAGEASAETSLRPEQAVANDEEIVNLNDLAGHPLDPALIEDMGDERVVSRLVLRAGKVASLHSEARWKIGEKQHAMANRVVWRIENFSDEQARWTPLHDDSGQQPAVPPLSTLAGDDGVIRVDVFHVTEDSLPPTNSGTLRTSEVQDHFKAFYELYGVANPTPDRLPSDPKRIGGIKAFAAAVGKDARSVADHHVIHKLATAFELAANEADIPEFLESQTYNCPTGQGK